MRIVMADDHEDVSVGVGTWLNGENTKTVDEAESGKAISNVVLRSPLLIPLLWLRTPKSRKHRLSLNIPLSGKFGRFNDFPPERNITSVAHAYSSRSSTLSRKD